MLPAAGPLGHRVGARLRTGGLARGPKTSCRDYPEWEPGRDEHEQYREHILASLRASPWARVIKASDFTGNAVGIIHTTGPELSKLARKYGPLVPALRELILRPDTPLEADVKDMIAGQLDAAQGRVRCDRASPRRRQWGQAAIRRSARFRLAATRALHRRKPDGRDGLTRTAAR